MNKAKKLIEMTSEKTPKGKRLSTDDVLKVIEDMSNAIEHQGVINKELSEFILDWLSNEADEIANRFNTREKE